MKSGLVSDAVCPAAPTAVPVAPALPQQDAPAASFGSVLQQATDSGPEKPTAKTSADVENSDAASTSNSDAASDSDECQATKSKKKQDDTTAAVALVCSCPPPTIDSASTAGKKTQSAGEAVNANSDKPVAPATSQVTPPTLQAQVTADTQTIPNSQTLIDIQPLAQTVQPKTTESKPSTKSGHGAKSSGRIALDPKLFEPIADDPIAAASIKTELPKVIQPQAPPVANASHGTLVAQLENHVKNTEKSAEIAPANEQKMPGREVLRRTVAELSRVESFHADKGSRLLVSDFDVAPSEVVPVKSADAAHLVETIRTEVASLRQRGDNMVTVVLRPDTGTQLSINLSIARDGSVHAVARFERGDLQSLQTQWPQLQQSLAAHGIRVADLSSSNQSNNNGNSQHNAQQQDHRSGGNAQNFARGENPQRRDQRDTANFEEQFTVSRSKFSQTKTQPQPAMSVPATRRWQSWA
jgi:hypothetical protein